MTTMEPWLDEIEAEAGPDDAWTVREPGVNALARAVRAYLAVAYGRELAALRERGPREEYERLKTSIREVADTAAALGQFGLPAQVERVRKV